MPDQAILQSGVFIAKDDQQLVAELCALFLFVNANSCFQLPSHDAPKKSYPPRQICFIVHYSSSKLVPILRYPSTPRPKPVRSTQCPSYSMVVISNERSQRVIVRVILHA